MEEKIIKAADVRQEKGLMLNVENLSISFGGLKAVENFHMQIKKHELYGLIGPNGAGKTTVFNLLTSRTREASCWTAKISQASIPSTSTTRASPVPSRISGFSATCRCWTTSRRDFTPIMFTERSLAFSGPRNSTKWSGL